MADKLTAQDYRGMTPEQITQVRALGQQDQAQSLQFAKAIVDTQLTREQMMETKRATRVREKLQLVGQEIDRRFMKRQLDLQSRQEESVRQLREAQSDQAKATAERMRLQIDNEKKVQNFLGKTMVQPKELNEPISLLKAKFFQDAGMKLTYGAEQPELVDQEIIYREDGTAIGLGITLDTNGKIQLQQSVIPSESIAGPEVDPAAADEELDALSQEQRYGEDTIKDHYGISAFSGLQPENQPEALAMRQLTNSILRHEGVSGPTGVTGTEAGNRAIREVTSFYDNLKQLEEYATRWRSPNRQEVVSTLAPIMGQIKRYYNVAPSGVFPREEVNAVLTSLGYSQDEITGILRDALKESEHGS